MNIKQQNYKTTATGVDMKLEVEIIPVSDVERSKRFYQSLGWRFDDDVSPVDGVRIGTVHASGLSVLSHFRQGNHGGRAWLGRGCARSSPTSKRPMTTSSAAASTPVTCGTALRSRVRHGNPAPTRSAPATGRSYPSTIPTAIRG